MTRKRSPHRERGAERPLRTIVITEIMHGVYRIVAGLANDQAEYHRDRVISELKLDPACLPLVRKSRQPNLVRDFEELCWAMHQPLPGGICLSYPAIARAVGCPHHSTVIDAAKRYAARIKPCGKPVLKLSGSTLANTSATTGLEVA